MNTFQFYKLVDKIAKKVEISNTELDIHSLFISYGDKEFKHFFNKNPYPEELWSISKCFITVLVGILIDKKIKLAGKKLHLGTKVSDLLEELHSATNSNIYHLLTHTSGFTDSLKFSNVNTIGPDILKYIIHKGFNHTAGENFHYSNVGCYLLSIILQRHLNKSIYTLAQEELFNKLEIDSFEWKELGGYCSGATGLILDTKSIHKLGVLLRDFGYYKNKEIVSKNWINIMTSKQVLSNNLYDRKRVFPKYAHGLNMHICENGTFYSDAKNGQYLLINRDSNIVCTIRANQKKSNLAVTECLRGII